MTPRQQHALTHPAEGGIIQPELRTVTPVDRGANLLVVILAVDR